MRLNQSEIGWIKANREQIKNFLEKRFNEYVELLINEKDDKKSEVLKMWIKEIQLTINKVENISKLDNNKNPDTPEFTGV